MDIEKKLWPENFEEIESGEKDFELRLADFEISEGDNLILKEFNPIINDYTGRIMTKLVKCIFKYDAEDIDINDDVGLYENYTSEQLNKYGYYWIGI